MTQEERNAEYERVQREFDRMIRRLFDLPEQAPVVYDDKHSLFGSFMKSAGIEPNSDESRLAYKAWSAARDWFGGYDDDPLNPFRKLHEQAGEAGAWREKYEKLKKERDERPLPEPCSAFVAVDLDSQVCARCTRHLAVH